MSSCDSRFHSERSERNDDKQILNTSEKGTSLSVFQSNKQAQTHSDEMNSGDRSPVFVCSPCSLTETKQSSVCTLKVKQNICS